MNQCDYFEDLKAFLDGELSGERLRAVEEHLTICLECRAELDEIANMSWNVALSTEQPEPEDLRVRLLDAYTARTGKARTRRRTLWTLLPAAAAVAIGAYVMRPEPPSPRLSGPAYLGMDKRSHSSEGLRDSSFDSHSVTHTVRSARETSVDLRLSTRANGLADIETRWEPVRRDEQLAVFQVPVDQLEPLLNALRAAGEVSEVRQDTQTVSGDLGDLESRIRNLTQDQRDYVIQMRQASSVSEIVRCDQNIKRVREQIANLSSLRKMLGSGRDFASVTVRLEDR